MSFYPPQPYNSALDSPVSYASQTLTLAQKAIAQSNVFNVFTPTGADFPNLFIGDDAGNLTMTTSAYPDGYRGSSNIGIGNGTLKTVTTGYRNTAIGTDCMGLLTTGYHNTGCGHGVLQQITTGSYNSGFGIGSLLYITTGSNNTGYGGDTLFRTTTGNRNSALGRNALFENLTGDDNCAFGYNSLFLNTTGYGNSAFGGEALADCTVGFRNSAFGIAALRVITTGDNNTAIGDNAGSTITTGNSNVMVGYNSGSGLTTGSNNVCIGAATMSAADSGHVVISDGLGNRRLSFDGSGVGTFPGTVAFESTTKFSSPLRDSDNANRLRFLTTGDKETEITSGGTFITGLDLNGSQVFKIGSTNVLIGSGAGSGLTTGTNNVCIGTATMSAADSGHVILADGLGNRRLSFDPSGIASIPGVVKFSSALRDADNADRIRFVTSGDKETEITSGGSYINGLNSGGSELFRISSTRAQFVGGVVFKPQSSETLSVNGQMAFELVSNTSVRIKVRGSDGTTRVSTSFTLS